MLQSHAHLSLLESLAMLVASAIIVHLVYKRYEPAPSDLLPTTLMLVVTPAAVSTALIKSFSNAFSAYLLGFCVFYASLLSSIAIYRISPWHPLSGYPGPLLAKLSAWWLVSVILTGKRHAVLKALHDKYGIYVRIGPNELSFTDVDLVPEILGPHGMPKGPMFDGISPPNKASNLVATRDLADHAQKRKPWSRAFSTPSTREYGPIMQRRALQLSEELSKRCTEKGSSVNVVNLSLWLSYVSFDTMGDMVFGGGFELMRQRDVNGIWGLLTSHLRNLGWMAHVPWLTATIHRFPAAIGATAKFRNFTKEWALRRRANRSLVKDLFHYLNYEDDETSPSSIPMELVIENAEVAIIAGSDTTSAALSGLFYNILASHDVYKRLREELDTAFPLHEGEPFDSTKLSELKYLNAVINETLRMQPAIQTLQRAPAKGSGGKMIGKHFIPEGTAVSILPYCMHRDPRHFSPMPDKFWPDRWLSLKGSATVPALSSSSTSSFSATSSSPSLSPSPSTTFTTNTTPPPTSPIKITHDMRAYLPFSTGPANCVGRSFALVQMQIIVALLLQRFEFRLADGYDTRRWEEELREMFLIRVGALPVVITRRI